MKVTVASHVKYIEGCCVGARQVPGNTAWLEPYKAMHGPQKFSL